MKKFFVLFPLMALPACFGVGNGVDLTPTNPDSAVTSQMATQLAGARAANDELPLEFEPTVGRVAQDHANEMYERNFLDVLDGGDLGDDLNDKGLPWVEIVQMVAQGDMSVAEVFNQFNTTGGAPGSNSDSIADWNAAMDNELFLYFGLGKAGSGDDTRWAILLVDPQ